MAEVTTHGNVAGLRLQVYDDCRQMVGAGHEQFLDPDVVLHCLEGQVALLHHVMAFEEANRTWKVLTDTQRWKATFAAYILGAVSQSQLTRLEKTTHGTAGVSYTSSHNWVIKTSKKSQLRPVECENFPYLQAFKWAPMKILAFLLSNSKSRFAIHLQLRELGYDTIGAWDIYMSLSAFQGHTRYSDVASNESYGKELSFTELKSLGWVFHCTNNSNWESIRKDGLLLSTTRGGQEAGRRYAGGETRPAAGAVILYGKDISFTAKLVAGSSTRPGTSCISRAVALCCPTSTCPWISSTSKIDPRTRKMRAESDGTSASSRPVRKADIFIRDPQGQPLRKRIYGSGTWQGAEGSRDKRWKRGYALGTTSVRSLRLQTSESPLMRSSSNRPVGELQPTRLWRSIYA